MWWFWNHALVPSKAYFIVMYVQIVHEDLHHHWPGRGSRSISRRLWSSRLQSVEQKPNFVGALQLGRFLLAGQRLVSFSHLTSMSTEQIALSRLSLTLRIQSYEQIFAPKNSGNSYESIECLRRSLHFSPRKHADVALLNLANVLHRGRFSSEAAIVLHAALDNAKVRYRRNFSHLQLLPELRLNCLENMFVFCLLLR